MKPIILASTSPRRIELMRRLGLAFQTASSNYEEDMNSNLKPTDLAKALSAGKAEAVASLFPDHIIIGADTFIALEGELLGKPHTEVDATQMLKRISGKSISVITGFTILDTSENKRLSRAVETKVYIKNLSDKEIVGYVKTKEPLDKSGAFAIQGIGAVFVRKIDGDFFNVMGLPLFDLSESLKEFGIHIFP
ncbi:MAG: nucleoside triphosphate pyrophosphatase [bacterium]|nr:nucleoside triphosphate pyrophosphatase [bacterium]